MSVVFRPNERPEECKFSFKRHGTSRKMSRRCGSFHPPRWVLWVWLFWALVILLLIFLKNRQAVLLLPKPSAVRVASSPCKQAIMEDIAASYATEGSN